MAYNKTLWVNDSLPAINAGNLNKIEQGIEESYIFRNLLHNDYSKGSSTTINGVTFTINDDGSIKVKGTASTSSANSYFWILSDESSIKLNENKQYTFSAEVASGTFNGVVRIVSKTDTSNFKDLTSNTLSQTMYGSFFTDNIKVFIRISSGIYYDYTIKLQLEENNSSTPYTPFASYIEESGSNSNGNWIKYSDGTMICFMQRTENVTMTEASGALYGGNTSEIIFPQSFISKPIVNTSIIGEYLALVGRIAGVSTNKIGYLRLFKTTSSTNPITYDIIAIGRWK